MWHGPTPRAGRPSVSLLLGGGGGWAPGPQRGQETSQELTDCGNDKRPVIVAKETLKCPHGPHCRGHGAKS